MKLSIALALMSTLALMVPTTNLFGQSTGEQAHAVVVAWQSDMKSRNNAMDSAKEVAKRLSAVIGKEVPVAKWTEKTPDAKLTLLISNAQQIGGDVAKSLENAKLDAFTIRYPYEVDGRTVCLLSSRDDRAEDYPGYYFLKKFVDVHYVGPGELGVVWNEQPNWKLPDQINIVEDPDFQMRLWTGESFSSRPWLARSGRMGFHHALGYIFSPAKHGDKPDVYPLINGKRFIPGKDKHSKSAGWQPCVSDPLSIEIAKNHVLEHLEKNPHILSVSLSVNDGAGNMCECEECVALDLKPEDRRYSRDYANRFFWFYNKVMAEVEKVNPDAYIAVLSYGPCNMPPVGFKVHPRVLVFQVNPTPEKLAAWHNAGATPNLYLWLWEGGFMTVRPDQQSLEEVVKQSRDYGGLGVYSEIIAQWGISAPKFYVLAHLLWDADRSADQLLGEYCDLAYGTDAGPMVKQWFEHWHAIHRRFEKPFDYHIGWRQTAQFQNLRRSDIVVLQESLDRASKQPMSESQRNRFEIIAAHHELMAANADQYLSSLEFNDPAWLEQRTNEQILANLELSTNLTARVNAVWDKYFATDEEGWFVDPKHGDKPQDFWNKWYVQVRTIVESQQESAIFDGIGFINDRLSGSAAEKSNYWKAQLAARSALAPWINSQIRSLSGQSAPSVVTNGNFEDAAAGPTPQVPDVTGWQVYQQYGSVKASRNIYSVETGTGHDGGRAFGIGEGLYGELRTFFNLEADKRYTLSFWYKTENRTSKSAFWIYGYEQASGDEKPKISRFYRLNLEPTDGKWVHVQRTFVANRTGTYMTQFSSYRHKKDEWSWFDDFEIRQR